MKKTIIVAWLAVLLATAGCGGSSETLLGQEDGERQSSPPLSSETETITYAMAADFTLSDLAGNAVKLSSLRGKPVFLNFWATWCGPCVAEMPGIKQLHTEQGANVHVVCVNLRESRATVNNYLRGKGYSWTFLFDASGDVAKTYKISAIPTTFVIDSDGRVRGRHVGSMKVDAMRSMLAAAQ